MELRYETERFASELADWGVFANLKLDWLSAMVAIRRYLAKRTHGTQNKMVQKDQKLR